MPCTNSNAYSVSFHPSIDEFRECKVLFLKQFKLLYQDIPEYILTPEKGNADYFTHYQGFIVFEKERRSSDVRKQFMNKVLKDIEIDCIKIALKITPITRDVMMCRGYPLKELVSLHDTNTNLTDKVLLEAQLYYLKFKNEKKMRGDKIKVNNRNLGVIFMKYYTNHLDGAKQKEKDFLKQKKYTPADVMLVLSNMDRDGYYISNILMGKNIDVTVEYLTAKLNDDVNTFIRSRYSDMSSISEDNLDRAKCNNTLR